MDSQSYNNYEYEFEYLKAKLLGGLGGIINTTNDFFLDFKDFFVLFLDFAILSLYTLLLY